MTKAELVAMDERFIGWLANADSDYEEWKNKRFIIVEETKDSELTILGFDALEKLKEYAEIDEEESGWFVVAIFDLHQKKQLSYARKVIIEIS